MMVATERPPVVRGIPLADCRLCGAPIRFVRLDTGNTLPVNPAPNPRGNVAAGMSGRRLVGFVLSRDKQPSVWEPLRFVPHHATCVEYERERKPVAHPEPREEDTPLW